MGDSTNVGGRMPRNFRRANIAEGLAVEMLRPFAAVAPVPRAEDYGLDAVATLLRSQGSSLLAEDSFVVQVKTHTAAQFEFCGDGVEWLRRLTLPYFPLVMNLDTSSASLYTLNAHHLPIQVSRNTRYNFCLDLDGVDDFNLGPPLMTWSVADCGHHNFPEWAFSILKPAIQVEAANQKYGPMWRFTKLVGDSFTFADRAGGVTPRAPQAGDVTVIPPGDRETILKLFDAVIGPLVNVIANTRFDSDRGPHLIQLRSSLRQLGIDPDPSSTWDAIAEDLRP